MEYLSLITTNEVSNFAHPEFLKTSSSQDKTTLVTIFEVSHLNVKRCDLDVENNTKTTLNWVFSHQFNRIKDMVDYLYLTYIPRW